MPKNEFENKENIFHFVLPVQHCEDFIITNGDLQIIIHVSDIMEIHSSLPFDFWCRIKGPDPEELKIIDKYIPGGIWKIKVFLSLYNQGMLNTLYNPAFAGNIQFSNL